MNLHFLVGFSEHEQEISIWRLPNNVIVEKVEPTNPPPGSDPDRVYITYEVPAATVVYFFPKVTGELQESMLGDDTVIVLKHTTLQACYSISVTTQYGIVSRRQLEEADCNAI